MKSIIYTFTVLLFLIGCSKNSTPKTNPPALVDSVSLVTRYSVLTNVNNSMTADTLLYDQNNNIKSITHQYINNLGPDQTLDSGTYYFTMNATNTHPSSYKLIYRKYYQTDAVIENHILSYDDSNRVMLDSTISTTSTEENIEGIHYAYFPDAVVLHIYQEGQFDLLDSILSSAGNFNYFSESYPDENGWSKNFSYTREVLTNYNNPFYTNGLSKSQGAFFIFENNMDFLSKNLTTIEGFFYTWKTDTKGRVLNGTAPDGSFVKFTYQ
jgi:hypothetical protein